MGGQDRRDRDVRDDRVEVAIAPACASEPPHGVADRVVEDAVTRRPLAPAQRPHAAMRLGQVDEPEVERERADHSLGRPEVETAQLVVQPCPLSWVVVLAQGDRALADPLDQGKQLRAGLFGDHLAEQRAQETDLDRKRIAGSGCPDPARFGRHRRRRRVVVLVPAAHAGASARPFRAQAATASQPFRPATFRRLVWCLP